MYLFNGTCVENCPVGYVDRHPNWVFSGGRMVGNTCEKKQSYALNVGHGDNGGLDPSITSGVDLFDQ